MSTRPQSLLSNPRRVWLRQCAALGLPVFLPPAVASTLLGQSAGAQIPSMNGLNNSHRLNPPKAVVFFPGEVAYFESQKVGMLESAKLHGLDLHFEYSNWDALDQLRRIERVLLQPVSAIAVCTVDGQALSVLPRLQAQLNSHVPIVTFTNAIGADPQGKFAGVEVFVGRDEVKAGEILGQLALAALPKGVPGRILLIEGAPGTTPQRLRTQGLLDVLSQHPSWSIVHRLTSPGWRTDNIEVLVPRFTQQPFNLVVTQWAAGATAVVKVLTGTHAENVPIVTLEYSSAVQKAILAGRIYGTARVFIVREGHQVIDTMVQILEGRAHPTFVETPQTIVTRANAATERPEW